MNILFHGYAISSQMNILFHRNIICSSSVKFLNPAWRGNINSQAPQGVSEENNLHEQFEVTKRHARHVNELGRAANIMLANKRAYMACKIAALVGSRAEFYSTLRLLFPEAEAQRIIMAYFADVQHFLTTPYTSVNDLKVEMRGSERPSRKKKYESSERKWRLCRQIL